MLLLGGGFALAKGSEVSCDVVLKTRDETHVQVIECDMDMLKTLPNPASGLERVESWPRLNKEIIDYSQFFGFIYWQNIKNEVYN